ncbi:substrate-binding domain-containing protein [Nocardia sp. NPDC005998]|uniref:substrate-binding domain-containing protein n=1 Tax=Nocardia sp. NPDC005998 TaxID=3156894 RepID=UPI0033A19744
MGDRRDRNEPDPPADWSWARYGRAAAALRAIIDTTARIPQDISVVGCDGDRTNTYGQLVPITVQQPIDTIARTALTAVLSTDIAADASPVAIDVQLDLGETCGCRPPMSWSGLDQFAQAAAAEPVMSGVRDAPMVSIE